MFIPRELVAAVGDYMDGRFQAGAFPYIKNHAIMYLRSVYSTDSLTAANGVLHDGNATDFICVNFDGFQRSQWGVFNAELDGLMAELSAEFPRQIRTHPGKYNAPLSPDPESQEVKDLIAQYDPIGIFARDSFDGSYLQESTE